MPLLLAGRASAAKSSPATFSSVVTRQVSAPLKEIIRHTNQKSDNNYAAQLLALIGKAGGQSPDWRGGLTAVYAYLDARGFVRGEGAIVAEVSGREKEPRDGRLAAGNRNGHRSRRHRRCADSR